MGPIETSLRERAHIIHERLKNTQLPLSLQIIECNSKISQLETENTLLKKRIEELDRELTQATLKLMRRHPVQRQIIHRIITLISKHERVSVDDLLGPRRTKDIYFPRQIGFYLACRHTKCGLPAIGRQFGNKDHSTVIHGRDKIARLRKIDGELHNRLCSYENELKNWPIK